LCYCHIALYRGLDHCVTAIQPWIGGWNKSLYGSNTMVQPPIKGYMAVTQWSNPPIQGYMAVTQWPNPLHKAIWQ